MSRFLRVLCGCSREPPGEEDAVNLGAVDSNVRIADVQTVALRATECSKPSPGAPLQASSDGAGRNCSDWLTEAYGRDIQASACIARLRSSNNVEALAPLAEDEALAPPVQGSQCSVNGERTEVHWSVHESCRNSCPAVGANAFPETCAVAGQQNFRAHSHVLAPRNAYCVSPVSVATTRSLASPFRHDFMTLMRQASNRASSSGTLVEPGSLQQWSPRAAPDANPAHRVDWTPVRQSHGSIVTPAEAAHNRRQRRASAYAASNDALVRGAAGARGNPRPPCLAPNTVTVATFSRCSSSPDIRNGAFLMESKCAGESGADGLPDPCALKYPQPQPQSDLQSPLHSLVATLSAQQGHIGAGGSSGGSSSSRGANSTAAVRAHPYGGSATTTPPFTRPPDLRGAQQPGHSPLRPRDLLTATATPTRYSGAVTSLGRCHGSSSSSQTSPACVAGSASYQHGRLLQQLREQHELQQLTCAAGGGGSAAAVLPAEPAVAAAGCMEAPRTPLSALFQGYKVGDSFASPLGPAGPLIKPRVLIQSVLLASAAAGIVCPPAAPGGASDASGAPQAASGCAAAAAEPGFGACPHSRRSTVTEAVVAAESQLADAAAGVSVGKAYGPCGPAALGPDASGRPRSARSGCRTLEAAAEAKAAGDACAAAPHITPIGTVAEPSFGVGASSSVRVLEQILQRNVMQYTVAAMLAPEAKEGEEGNRGATGGAPSTGESVWYTGGTGRVSPHALVSLAASASAHGGPVAGPTTCPPHSHLPPDQMHHSQPLLRRLAPGLMASDTMSLHAPGSADASAGHMHGGVALVAPAVVFGGGLAHVRSQAGLSCETWDNAMTRSRLSATSAAIEIPASQDSRQEPKQEPPSEHGFGIGLGGCSPAHADAAAAARTAELLPLLAEPQRPMSRSCSPAPDSTSALAYPSGAPAVVVVPAGQAGPPGPGIATAAAAAAASELPVTGGDAAAAYAAASGHTAPLAPRMPCATTAGVMSSLPPLDGSCGAAELLLSHGIKTGGGSTAGGSVLGLGAHVASLSSHRPGGGGSGVGSTGGEGSSLRDLSLVASETSLTAIALLRSAAANMPFPDDSSVVDVTATATVTGGAGTPTYLQLDGAALAPAPSAAMSAAAGAGVGDGGACGGGGTPGTLSAMASSEVGGLSSPFTTYATVLIPGQPQAGVLVASPRLGPESAPLGSPSNPQPPAQPSTGSSAQSLLRLEDGLVSDPLVLVDGLGQLSYITSGAYAAVYRGSWEDLPAGIKFLASTSLDLNSPAVKEALLGPGLDHQNIIRTFTTRVARVDHRAVAQLRAVAAAMAATASAPGMSLNRRRNGRTGAARRCSSSTTGAGSVPLQPPPPLPAVPALPAAATPARPVTIVQAALPAPAGAAPGTKAGTASTAGPGLRRVSTVGTGMSGGVLYHSAASPQQPPKRPGQGSLSPSASPPALPLSYSEPSCDAAAQPGPGREPAKGPTVGPAAAAAAADPNGAASSRPTVLPCRSGLRPKQSGSEGPSAARLIFMRRSSSANARETASVGDVSAALVATAASRQAVSEAAGLTPSNPPRPAPRVPSLQRAPPGTSGVARAPSLSPSAERCSSVSGVVGSAGTSAAPAAPAAAGPRAPARGHSAADRMLDVLRTLRVVGPTGQATAPAHYVTAVVMEFADEGNLDSFSRSGTPCDLATAVELLRQVASGMCYLHAHGLVHGDLKPANVLLVRDRFTKRLMAKVADFGLSGLSGQQGTSGGAETCGTIAYSAPERLSEDGVAEQAADVYSFGICMHQLVSGERPFADLAFGQILFGVLCRGMKPEWPAGRCGALELLYNMCCDLQPSKRPTFEQVVTWLDSLWF